MRSSLRFASVAAGLFALSLPATAQVFVIGNGLGAECYGKTARQVSNFIDAETTCTRALREESMNRENRAKTYTNRGVLRMRAGRYDQALSDYSEAIRLRPELGEAWLNQGAAHIYKDDFGPALQSLNTAIDLGTKDLFAAYYNRAIAKEGTGDVEGAYYDFKKSLELKPEWSLAQRQLARFTVTPTIG
ncbi:MAG: tetratricopeptide repeat protein [Pseudomonadota bacterium]